ncbi:MAG: N-acetylmuramoyl-L-alanine amidase [Oscillospiraceae bacterium]|nr:N-acetylmuramoyl-L-alanine amidase [Oscillospiraceae bacterium]
MREEQSPVGFESILALFVLSAIWTIALLLSKSPLAIPADDLYTESQTPVLIIDPGHGGLDGGASTADGRPESAYNLQIGLRLRDLSSFLGIQTVMTREGEELDYPPELQSIAEKKRWDTRCRAEKINAIQNGYLLSIHQNYYPSQKPHGSQVLYAQTPNSRLWAERTQALFTTYLDTENQRLAVSAGQDIYLLSHVQCPAILVECGFLSNPREAARLGEHSYQLKLAVLMAESFLKITEENRI